jgi:hypothetical protein
MKKHLFLLITLLTALYCQGQELRLGLQLSPNLNWMKGQEHVEDNGKGIGFSFGLIGEYFFTDNYGFSSGLFITNGAAKIKYTGPVEFKEEGEFTSDPFSINDTIPTGTTGHYKQARYIELPILLKLRTNEIGYITYYGVFGVTPGINIKSQGEFDPSLGNLPDVTILKMNPINLQLTVGGGLEYSFGGNTSFVTGIFYNNGFTGVTRDEEKVILNNLLLRLGVMF